MIAYVVLAVLLVALAGLALSVRILKQYERAVMFHLGKVRDGARGPGLIFFAPLVNQVHRVSLRIVTMPIQSQGHHHSRQRQHRRLRCRLLPRR
jgi:regulator of protease activity HflC (stomatin/prohibitin superfamily)